MTMPEPGSEAAKEAGRVLNAQKRRAKALSTEHLNCRVGGIRHHWERKQPDWTSDTRAVQICMQCAHCGTIRRVEVSPRWGEVLKDSYDYPPGYLLRRQEGDGPEKLLSPAAVRLELAKRDLPLSLIDDSWWPNDS